MPNRLSQIEAITNDIEARSAFHLMGPLETPEPPAEASELLAVHGVAYSGQVIPNHWFWGNLILDLEGGTARDRILLLTDHELDKISGVIERVTFDKAIGIEGWADPKEQHGAILIRRLTGSKPYPLQMSVWFEPLFLPGVVAVEYVPPGVTVTVNGNTMTGEGHVIRHYQIKEVSAVPFGADQFTEIAARLSAKYAGGSMSAKTQSDLEKQLAEMRAENERYKQQLADADTAARKSAMAAFDTAGFHLSEESREALAGMPVQSLAQLLGDLKKGRRELPETLFHEMAPSGGEDTQQLESDLALARQMNLVGGE